MDRDLRRVAFCDVGERVDASLDSAFRRSTAPQCTDLWTGQSAVAGLSRQIHTIRESCPQTQPVNASIATKRTFVPVQAARAPPQGFSAHVASEPDVVVSQPSPLTRHGSAT